MSVSYSFSPNTKIKSAEVNTNFTDIWPIDWTSYTPVISGSTAAGTGTYTSRVGSYCQIGKIVFFSITVTWTAHTGTGNFKVSLPLTSVSTANKFWQFTVALNNYTMQAETRDIAGRIAPNNDYAIILENRTGLTTFTGAIWNSGAFVASGFYEVA